MTSPKLAGVRQAALARHERRLDAQEFASHFGPGQSGHLTDLVMLVCPAVTEPLDAKVLFKALRRYRNGLASILIQAECL